MIVVLWAALAMLAQDVIGVAYMQAAARNRTWLAGVLDAVTWLVMIATTKIAVQASGSRFVAVLFAVTAANILGTAIGVKLGKRFIRQG